MLWLCTNAKIDWNAISAIGTGAAALIALVIWLVDRRDKHLRLKADGRLAAQLVYTETIPMLAHLAIMKNRLQPRPDRFQPDWDVDLAAERNANLAFYTALAPKVRSERLERMLESNTSLTPELTEAVADMLASTLVSIESAILIFGMDEVGVYSRLTELRESFEDAHTTMERAQTIALERARDGRLSPHSVQLRMKRAARSREARERAISMRPSKKP